MMTDDGTPEDAAQRVLRRLMEKYPNASEDELKEAFIDYLRSDPEGMDPKVQKVKEAIIEDTFTRLHSDIDAESRRRSA